MEAQTIIRACAWCNHMLDQDNNPVELVQVFPGQQENISHGCCNKCQVGVNAELLEYRAMKASQAVKVTQ